MVRHKSAYIHFFALIFLLFLYMFLSFTRLRFEYESNIVGAEIWQSDDRAFKVTLLFEELLLISFFCYLFFAISAFQSPLHFLFRDDIFIAMSGWLEIFDRSTLVSKRLFFQLETSSFFLD